MTHWFYCGLAHGIYHPITKSPLLHCLISQQHLNELVHIGDHDRERTLHRTWFPSEQLLAYSLIIPRLDTYGRHGHWNYTRLLTFHDYLALTDSNAVIGQHPSLFHESPPLEVTT